MAITFRGNLQGYVDGTTSATIISLGESVGDVLLAIVQTKYGGSTCSSGTWTRVNTFTAGSGTGVDTGALTQEVWTKIADGTAADHPTFTIAGTQSVIQVAFCAGVRSTGNPVLIDVFTGTTGSVGTTNAIIVTTQSGDIKTTDLVFAVGGSVSDAPAVTGSAARFGYNSGGIEQSSTITELDNQIATGDDMSMVQLGVIPSGAGALDTLFFRYVTGSANNAPTLATTIVRVREYSPSFDPMGMRGFFGI